MKKELNTNDILGDLDSRNDNWDKLDGVPEKVADNSTRIDILDGYILKDIENFKDVQRIVRMGIADKVFTVGDQFEATVGGKNYLLDVVAIDHDKPSDPKYKHSITLQFHDVVRNAQFSAPQALGHTDKILLAGVHVFTFDEKQYKFTTTENITEGGVLLGGGWSDYVPGTVTTYKADRTTVIESGLAVTATSGETDTITDINDKSRSRYGSNNYVESAVKQWLNSEEDIFKWVSKTKFDMPSTYETEGFMNLLDSDLVKVLGKVDRVVARNTVTDVGGQDTYSDKVYLPTRVEIYGGTEGTTTGEAPYDYYSMMEDVTNVAAVDWRVKYLDKVARHWWLSSPYVGTSYGTRGVHPSGSVTSNGAFYAGGVAPACVII